MPDRRVTPDKPNVASMLVPALFSIAETTASSLTTNPRNFPVFAEVLETTLQPVYPAEKLLAEMLILIKLY